MIYPSWIFFSHARPLLPEMPCLNTPVPEKAKPSLCAKAHLLALNEPSIHHNTIESAPGDLGGGDGLAHARTTLSRVQALLTANNGLGLLDDLLGLGKDELDVAGVGHVGVDLDSHISQIMSLVGRHVSTLMRCRVKHTRPWAR